MSLFIIPSQSIIGKILPNLWERHLEKPLLYHIIADILCGLNLSNIFNNCLPKGRHSEGPLKSISFVHKTIPGVGWVMKSTGWVGGVGWFGEIIDITPT